MSSPRVLVYIVEDDPEHRILLHQIVKPRGFRPRAFASGEEFLRVYDRLSPGIILLDLRLPGMCGATLVEELARRRCRWPVVLLAAQAGWARLGGPHAPAGAIEVLRKPVKWASILHALEHARGKLTAARGDKRTGGIEARFAMLKPGERAVLDGLREGLMAPAIARRCAVSERTVRARLQQMLKKTGASSREHLLQLALSAGIPLRSSA